jgi:hypothetical protein
LNLKIAENGEKIKSSSRGIASLPGMKHWKRTGRSYKMDVTKILAELREERQQIEEAIVSLERLARGRGRRRGRPPAWMADLSVKRRGRPPGSKNKTQVSNAAAARGTAVA